MKAKVSSMELPVDRHLRAEVGHDRAGQAGVDHRNKRQQVDGSAVIDATGAEVPPVASFIALSAAMKSSLDPWASGRRRQR